jgi:hypothetical protein
MALVQQSIIKITSKMTLDIRRMFNYQTTRIIIYLFNEHIQMLEGDHQAYDLLIHLMIGGILGYYPRLDRLKVKGVQKSA